MRTGYGITSKLPAAGGATGPMGPQGTAGSKGDKGNDGATGGIGPMGATGQNGLPGVNGTNGTNGAQGIQGPAGPAGLDAKRIDTYNGTTDANGLFTVTYTTAFPAIPSVQPEPPLSANQTWVKVTSTATGFSMRLVQRAAVTLLSTELLLAAVTNVVGASVKATVIAA